MNMKLGFAMITLGALAAVGCTVTTDGTGGTGGTGTTSSTTTTSSKSTTTGTTTASTTVASSSSTGGGPCVATTTDVSTCAGACQVLFECGVETCGGTDQQCPGFAPMGAITEMAWHGGGMNGCDAQCNAAGAAIFVGLGVDPMDCVATINAFSTNPITMGNFKAACGN
jgi:hypothetical protein